MTASAPIRITLPSDPTKWVDLKSTWFWGDTRAMEKARAAEANDAAGALAFAEVLLQRVIVDWNLTDDGGNVLPVTAANIDTALDGKDAQQIVLKAIEIRGPAPSVNGAAVKEGELNG